MHGRKLLIGLCLVLALAIGAITVFAGDPDNPPGTPAGTTSYTLEDIYNRLDAGATGSQSTFAEPSTGPSSGTMHTLNEIMAAAPSVDDADGAVAADVLSGKTFWGLTSGAWGTMSGSMTDNGAVTLTPSTSDVPIAEGYHDGSGYVEGDEDLVPENIRCGITLFGVEGSVLPDCVAKTGVTQCWDASGTLIDCAGTGQDGEYQAGCLPVVAAPSGTTNSFGNYTRLSFTCTGGFRDNGDGTVTDELTGLVWLKDATCLGTGTWANSLTAANTLADGSCGLTDGSVAGDWRLPNINEMRSLLDESLEKPYLPAGHPFTDVVQDFYWTSNSGSAAAGALCIRLKMDPYIGNTIKTYGNAYRWPVRDGE